MTVTRSRPADALAGGGEMGERIRSHDWAATPLGPIERWPHSLKTSLSLILGAQMPMWLGWGRDMYFFYNDAYIQVLSLAKHPSALGRPAAEIWKEIWHVCGPLADKVFERAEAPFMEDVRLFMDRGDAFLEECYYSFSYSPIRDESGQVGGLFCPNTEVTAKLLNARRLRTLSELSEKALVEKTISSACASAAETLGRNPDDVPFALIYLWHPDTGRMHLEQCVGVPAGHPMYCPEELGLDDDDAAHAWPVARVFRTREPRTVAVAHNDVLPLGLAEQRVTTAIAVPISTAGQERPLGVLVAGVNPTRRLDREYTTFFELLSDQVATALQNALAAEEEKRRADMLAEIDRAKTTFFSNVSHEFRTPLTLMIGPTEDALGSPERALRGESLETVYRNELRLLKLVNSLLDFSRLEAGRMFASLELVDLGALTADLASAFRAAIERADLALHVSVEPTMVGVDRDMWEKIVLNLLSNALKFTLAGEIRVRLRQRGSAVELTVADTGTGIPEDQLPRLFERFHRVENAQARTHEGSGIGLALVQELVRLHDGTIAVESQLGHGTTFTVTIPIRRDVAEPPAADARGPSDLARASFVGEAQRWTHELQADTAPARGAAHVLLADDNADMRDYLRRLLSEHWRVTAVNDGQAALEVLGHEPVDLVLSDVMMPRLDGFGLLAAVRADPLLDAVPVILLSARAGDEARVEGLGAGADDYMVKPFSARELIARVRTHLSVAQARRRAESSLEDLYALFMQVPAAVTVRRGADLRCVFQNHASTAVRDQRGERLAESGLPQALIDLHRQVRQTGEPVSRRETSGEAAWHGLATVVDRFWDETWAPVRLADGSIDGVISIAFEVTDLVDARQRVRDAEERRRVAFDAAGVGTWRVDLSTGLDTRDAALNRLLGLPEVESTQPVEDFVSRIHPEDRACAAAAIERSMAHGDPYEKEMRIVRPDGSVRWIRDVGRAVRDAHDNLVAFTGAAADVTDRRLAEEERESASRRLSAALAASDVGTYFWDIPSNQVAFDDGVRRLFGLDPEQGGAVEHYTARVHPDDRDGWLRALRNCSEFGADFNLEFRVVWPDGTVRWVLDKGQMTHDAHGRPRHLVGAVVDITEPRRLAESATSANRAKDEFLAMLGHELRNPLAPIVTALELMKLRGGPATHEQRVIERQIDHLTRLVDDLLDISRVTRGLIELKRETLSADAVLAQAIEIASPLMEQKKHRLRVDVEPGLTLFADPVRLAQVFANLLSNAARYTPAGGNIQVTAGRTGSRVRVEVTDDGIGIDPDVVGRIFDLFVQGGHRGPDRADGGLGIGLALVQTLVQMHGGEVSVVSDGVGRGSTFTVVLPLQARATTSPGLQQKARGGSVHARRVLVVDDNVDAADMLGEALRYMGHDVVLAHDGPQALVLVQTFSPDVAVLDIGLPVMDGYELARRLREAGLTGCKLIALTGYGQERDLKESEAAGFDLHMVKPVDLDRLAEALGSP